MDTRPRWLQIAVVLAQVFFKPAPRGHEDIRTMDGVRYGERLRISQRRLYLEARRAHTPDFLHGGQLVRVRNPEPIQRAGPYDVGFNGQCVTFPMADRVTVEAGVGADRVPHSIEIDPANIVEHAEVHGDLARRLDDLHRHSSKAREAERKTTSHRIRLLLAVLSLFGPIGVTLRVSRCQLRAGWHAWRWTLWDFGGALRGWRPGGNDGVTCLVYGWTEVGELGIPH